MPGTDSPDAGDIENGLNAWISSNRRGALRTSWPYAKGCGQPQQPGFPGRPCNYPTDGGAETRWHEVRPTFIETFLAGNVTDVDPRAVADPEMNARLYVGAGGWVMVAARWNGSTPAGPTTLDLPMSLPVDVTTAVEIDAYGLSTTVKPVLPGARQVAVCGGFSAVYLRRRNGPLVVQALPASPIILGPTNHSVVRLAVIGTAKPQSAWVNISAPTLRLNASRVHLPAAVRLSAGPNTTALNSAEFHRITITGEGCLPLVRWVQVVPSPETMKGRGPPRASTCPAVLPPCLPDRCEPFWTDALLAADHGACPRRLPSKWWCR